MASFASGSDNSCHCLQILASVGANPQWLCRASNRVVEGIAGIFDFRCLKPSICMKKFWGSGFSKQGVGVVQLMPIDVAQSDCPGPLDVRRLGTPPRGAFDAGSEGSDTWMEAATTLPTG